MAFREMTVRLNVLFLVFLLLAISSFSNATTKQKYVTCGTVLKILNTDFKVRLHSHDVKYGTGSGQQSVTGTEDQGDGNSHWLIKPETGKQCNRGEPIKCGTKIRLEHLATHKNLHSHRFQSPLGGGQEVSCYGDEQGEGDTGDHWEVICTGEAWLRDDSIMLKHIDTDMYLSASGRTFGRPINGQVEIAGVRSLSGAVHWQASEGLFLHAPETDIHSHNAAHHTEL